MAYVYLNPHKQQLENALQQRKLLIVEQQTLNQRLSEITQRIAEWEAYIRATSILAENDAGESLRGKSLADICRMALDAHGEWVSAQQVRAYINQLGIHLDYTNEMAVLHTTLRRVAQMGRYNGNMFYAKKGLPYPQGMVPV